MDSSLHQLESQLDTSLTALELHEQSPTDEKYQNEATWESTTSGLEYKAIASSTILLKGYILQKLLTPDGKVYWDDYLKEDPEWRSDSPGNLKIVSRQYFEMGGSRAASIPWPETMPQFPPPMRVFTVFPQLPTELRLKIWAHALPDPRVVRLSTQYLRGASDSWRSFDILQEFIPRVLCCREFWAVFNQHYHQIKIEGDIQNSLPNCFLDFRRDTLRVHASDLQSLSLNHSWLDLTRVEHLALIEDDLQLDHGNHQSVCTYAETMCPKLKTFTLLLVDFFLSANADQDENDLGHLIHIDGRFQDLELCEYRHWHGPGGPPDELGPELLARAKVLEDVFKNDATKDHKRWQSIKFNVAVWALDSTCTASHYYQHLFFAPVHPLSDQQWCFDTERPTTIECLDRCVKLQDLLSPYDGSSSLSIVCNLDGELGSRYDGVAKLFEEGGFQELDEDKEWRKFGGVELKNTCLLR